MTDMALVVAVGIVTFASRVSYLWRPRRTTHPQPFLDLFPLALFVSLATVGLATPDGAFRVGPGLAAVVGGVVGAVVGRRSIIWVLAFGSAAFYLARLL